MLFSLFYARTGVTNREAIHPCQFGLQKGGTYEINITASNPSEINSANVFLMNNEEWTKLQYRMNFLEAYSEINYSIPITGQTFPIKGTSEKKQVLYLLIVQNYPPIQFKFDILFKNGNSYLDYRQIPCKIVFPVAFSIALLVVFFWLCWNMYKKSVMTVQFWITFLAALIYDLHLIAQYCALLVADKNGASNGTTIFSSISDVINNSYFLMSIILVSTGYGFMEVQFELKHIFEFLSPLVAFILGVIPVKGTTALALMGVAQFIISLYIMYILYRNVCEVEKKVMAHMLLVSRRGIDPQTTPLADKLNIYKNMMYYVVSAIACFLILNLTYSSISTYAFEIIDFIIHIVLIIWFLYLYRPRRITIIDTDGEQEIMNLDELGGIETTLSTIHKDSVQKWVPGTPLPKEPKFVKGHKFERQKYTAIQDTP